MDYLDKEWDENAFPLAYLLTFRTYGTWLHGDDRGSVDTYGNNIYGTPRLAPNPNREATMESRLKQDPYIFNDIQRAFIEESITGTCNARGYELLAVNARTNHVHAVVSAQVKPEQIINGFKSHATRKLRENHLIKTDKKVWSRGGSERYLWKKEHVVAAIDYVLYSQGLLPFEIEDRMSSR
jgi:REP element-mobilizing transposase RayT